MRTPLDCPRERAAVTVELDMDGKPLLFCGEELAWAPGLGIAAKFLSAGSAPGILPDWRPSQPSA